MRFHTQKTLTKRGIKKVDKLITGFILGGVIASIYGIKKNEEVQQRVKEAILQESQKHTLASILKLLVFGIEKEKKPSFFDRIRRFFR